MSHLAPTARGRVSYHLRAPNQRIFIDVGGQVGRRIDPELDPTEVVITDVRHGARPSFERDGINFVRAPTDLEFRSEDDPRDAYERELAALLEAEIGALDVVVFDHTMRVDGASRRPARHVHGDYTAASAQRRLVDVLGSERATAWAAGHFAFVNVWRPIGGVVEQAPLGFALPGSVHAEDWLDIELVYPERRGQIQGLAKSPSHRWIYLSDMSPDEVAVFNVYDSAGRPPVAHTAIDLLPTPNDARPRRSIESRTIVRL